jgi:hypothetical protein
MCITFSGSYVSNILRWSNPASDKINPPMNDIAGNFSLNLFHQRQKIRAKLPRLCDPEYSKHKPSSNKEMKKLTVALQVGLQHPTIWNN